MQKSKLIALLQTLQWTEIRQLETYINTSFFNKNQSLIALFQWLTPYHPTYHHDLLTKETAFTALFPKKAYKVTLIRSLMSDLTKLIEKFLLYKRWEEQEADHHNGLLHIYAERHLDKYFTQQHTAAQKALEQMTIRDIPYYYQQYLVEEHAYQFNLVNQRYSKNTALQKVIKALDAYYIANKLRYCLAIVNRRNILTGEHTAFLFEEILTQLQDSPYLQQPLIAAYYHLILLFLHHDIVHLQLLQTLLNHSDTLPIFDLRQLYTGLINYCNQKVNEGDASFYQHMFDIYQLMLTQEIIFVNNQLSPNHYRNMVAIGLQLRQLDWTEQFIHQYQKKLPLSFRKTAFYYNLARLHYYKQAYDQTRICLLKVQFTDPFSHILCKKLLLQTYYELNETDALKDLVANFRDLLKRSTKLSPAIRKGYRHFVNYTIKLYRIKQGQKKSLKQLAADIKTLEIVRDKTWLLQKVEELNKNL